MNQPTVPKLRRLLADRQRLEHASNEVARALAHLRELSDMGKGGELVMLADGLHRAIAETHHKISGEHRLAGAADTQPYDTERG